MKTFCFIITQVIWLICNIDHKLHSKQQESFEQEIVKIQSYCVFHFTNYLSEMTKSLKCEISQPYIGGMLLKTVLALVWNVKCKYVCMLKVVWKKMLFKLSEPGSYVKIRLLLPTFRGGGTGGAIGCTCTPVFWEI